MSDEVLAPGFVEVSETGAGRYGNLIRVGRHRLAADEPVDVGGDDTGPMPHDFVLAGLGACTSMTVRMYAERKGLALKRISVRLSMRKVGEATEMTRDIALDGDLSPDERARLIEIANKCPVHKTLSGEIKILTHLVS
jgi:putative redox protein